MKNEILFVVFALPSLALGVTYFIVSFFRYVKTKQNKTIE